MERGNGLTLVRGDVIETMEMAPVRQPASSFPWDHTLRSGECRPALDTPATIRTRSREPLGWVVTAFIGLGATAAAAVLFAVIGWLCQ